MGLRDKVLAKVATTNKVGACAVARAYAIIKKGDAEDLRSLLAEPKDPRDPNAVSSRAIAAGLNELLVELGQPPISETTMRTHRNGQCGCGTL